jgi:multiple antibiotic resistance protein
MRSRQESIGRLLLEKISVSDLDRLEFAAAAFVTFFVVIDPIGVLPVYMALTARESTAARRSVAVRMIFLATMALLVFAIAGGTVFRFLGISLAAFRIAGGLLLLLLSVDMLLVRPSGLRTATEAEEREAEESTDVAGFPLAVPLIAGPGAITSVILITGKAGSDIVLQFTAVAALIATLLLSLAILLFASRLMSHLGQIGVNVAGRVFGIMLAGLAIQHIIDGIAASFPVLVSP